jgi:hypothetical protein
VGLVEGDRVDHRIDPTANGAGKRSRRFPIELDRLATGRRRHGPPLRQDNPPAGIDEPSRRRLADLAGSADNQSLARQG